MSADHADERRLEEDKENNLRESAKSAGRQAKERAFMELILTAYRAETIEQFEHLHGKRTARLEGGNR